MRVASLLLLLAAERVAAGPIHFSEAVLDPQADHSESAGGNGVLYDLVPGSGTVSTVDEWIEIYNASAAAVDLAGWRVEFADTSPAAFVFGVDPAVLRFSEGSGLTSLAPGGFALVGNPPGSMNNAIDLLLYDASGSLMDQWSIVGAGSRGAADESWHRVLRADGSFYAARGAITPLAPAPSGEPAPVPEPSSLLLATAGLAAAARARLRTARRDRLRAHAGRPRALPRPPPAPS